MVYKSLNDQGLEYMTNTFRIVRQVHSRTTRSSSANDLYLPPGNHKQIYIKTFGKRVKIWNSLSLNIRESVSLNCFKSTYLKNYFIATDQYQYFVCFILFIFSISVNILTLYFYCNLARALGKISLLTYQVYWLCNILNPP